MAISIYNEKNYLLNPEVCESFHDTYERNKYRWDAEKEFFQDTLKQYDSFIDEVANLLHQMGYSSALECSIMVSFLINHGYLSHDFDFSGKPADAKKEISFRLGTTIVTGDGCCRNYASLLMDVLQRLKLPVDNFYCYQGSIKKGFNKQANHVINLVRHDGNVYGIDTYNHNRLYHFKTPLKMVEVSSRTRYQLLYKPYYEITIGEANLLQIKQRLKRFQGYSEKPILNPFEYEERHHDTVKRMRMEYDTLYQFHEDTKELKEEIASSIQRVFTK